MQWLEYMILCLLQAPCCVSKGQHSVLPHPSPLYGAWFPIKSMRLVPSFSTTLILPNFIFPLTCASMLWHSFLSLDSFVNGTNKIDSGGGSWAFGPWPCHCSSPLDVVSVLDFGCFLNQFDLAVLFLSFWLWLPSGLVDWLVVHPLTLTSTFSCNLLLLIPGILWWTYVWNSLWWGPD